MDSKVGDDGDLVAVLSPSPRGDGILFITVGAGKNGLMLARRSNKPRSKGSIGGVHCLAPTKSPALEVKSAHGQPADLIQVH